jgi:DNA mismatch endonuclease (patch repair protein)
MAAIRSSGNRTEMALGKALFAAGMRYRKYRADILGRPDIVFPVERVAVFVDGDYWHCRLLVERGRGAVRRTLLRLPSASRAYWVKKFTGRVERDRYVTEALRRDGWAVLRFWESDVRRDLEKTAQRIITAVQRRRGRR